MDLPINFHEHLQLTMVGIRQSNISFNNITMESEKYIVCREKIDNFPQVIIFDMADTTNQKRLPINADSVIMHPRLKVFAVRMGKTIQMFDIEKIAKLKEHSNEDDVVFWKWIDDETVGIVTETAVYHWTMAGGSAPLKVFDRHPTMNGCQIINYRVDQGRQWLILIGISVKGNRVAGSMQLYNTERRISQPIEGHAACFLRFKMDGNPHPTNLFVFSVKNDQVGKLQIVEIGPPASGNLSYSKKFVDVPISAELAADFPISVQASSKHGVVYVITKHGFVHIFDVDSGTMIYSNRISGESIFITAEYSLGGFIGINRKGQVLSVSLNEDNMVEYIQQTNPDLARKLAKRWNSTMPLSKTTSILDLDMDEKAVPVDDFLSLSITSSPTPSFFSPPSSLLYSSKYDSPVSEIALKYEAVHIESNDRAERAERERDEVAAQLRELYVHHTDLRARAEKAERERDEFASRCFKLERKCREAMLILGREEKEETPLFAETPSQPVEPINWHANIGETNVVKSVEGSQADSMSLGRANYSSLFDDV